MDYKRGDSLMSKPPFKVSHAKGEEDKGSKNLTATKEGLSKTCSTKEVKGRDKHKEFTPTTNCFLHMSPSFLSIEG